MIRKVGNQPLNLSEAQIRYAMQHSANAKQAAIWLNVDINTFKKYAKLYIDSATGKSLFDLHRSEQAAVRAKAGWPRKLIPKDPAKPLRVMKPRVKYPLDDIFANKYPKYHRGHLFNRLLSEGILPECCDNCGYCTRREFDFKTPLKLWYRNGDENDLSKNNLILLCFNCYYLLSYSSPNLYENRNIKPFTK
mgnify:CR=1 FL=1